jgi:hypothetical protein
MTHTFALLTSLTETSGLLALGGTLIVAAVFLRLVIRATGTGFQPAPKQTSQAKEGLAK